MELTTLESIIEKFEHEKKDAIAGQEHSTANQDRDEINSYTGMITGIEKCIDIVKKAAGGK